MTEFREAWWQFILDAGMVVGTALTVGILVLVLCTKAEIDEENTTLFTVGSIVVVVVLGFLVFFVNAMENGMPS